MENSKQKQLTATQIEEAIVNFQSSLERLYQNSLIFGVFGGLQELLEKQKHLEKIRQTKLWKVLNNEKK